MDTEDQAAENGRIPSQEKKISWSMEKERKRKGMKRRKEEREDERRVRS